jgi:hypothetical protein
MDKKSFTSKIRFKSFEDFQADQAKIPSIIEEMKSVLAEAKLHTTLPKNTQDDITYIELRDWFIEGGEIWDTFNEDESHNGELWIKDMVEATDIVITFKWWNELKADHSNDVTGPNQEWDFGIDVETIHYYENEGSNEIVVPLRPEYEALAKEIIFEVNKNNI